MPSLTRRRFLGLAAPVAGLAAPVAGLAARPLRAESDPRRSVLLIIADDQGLTLGCYGDPAARTPNIDGLAAAGVRFTHAFATVSSCSPSRSVMLTGLHNHQSGQYGLAHAPHNQHTLETVQTLPALLKAAGYLTGIVGKMHVKPEPLYPFDRHVEGPAIGGNRDVAAMAREAGSFLAEARGRPFVLVVGYSDPHRAPGGFANERAFPSVTPAFVDPAVLRVPPHLPDWPEVRKDLAEYYAAVGRLDTGIGLLLEELRFAGRHGDTLVLYVSDNGIPFPGAKTNLYEPGIHLPLIAVAPGLSRPATTNRAMVSWTDLAPTILDWTRARGPEEPLGGRSLLPILRSEDAPGWDEVYASHTFHEITMYYPMRAVRTRRHKYILNLAHRLPYPLARDILDSPTWQAVLARRPARLGSRALGDYLRRPAEELYDLAEDPHEVRNLAGDPAYAPVLAGLRDKVRAFRERTRDSWPERVIEEV